ncbi:MAG: hypothetical protein R3E01_19810 [Pirellulaceae bacterium]
MYVTTASRLTIQSGQLTIGTTAQQLSDRSVPPLSQGVTITAATGNAGVIYVGGEQPAYVLEPGQSVTIPTTDMRLVYVAASEVDQSLSYIGY